MVSLVSALSGVVPKVTLCCTTRGHVFSGNDIQDGLWENYQEDLETGYTSLEWEEYVRENATDYLDDALFFEREEW